MHVNGILNLKSLKEQVYEYLQDQLENGALLPDSSINMGETGQKLGVSRIPLKDALLQLEMERFVSVLPRRGVVVNHIQHVHWPYQVQERFLKKYYKRAENASKEKV